MTRLLEGRAALVTGAGHGIGLATARLLVEQGGQVMIADVDESAAANAAAALGGPENHVRFFAGDLTRPGVATALVDATAAELGRLDIIVNAAGYNLNARVAEMDDRTWQRMLDIHVTAPFAVLRAAAPHFQAAAVRDREAGVETFRKVVNVASIATMGSAGQANYAAAKSALVGLTKSLAKEWGEYRVNVNAVAFGSIATRLTQPRTADNVMEVDGEPVQLGLSVRAMEAAARSIPSGRVGTPEEAAGGILLLCLPWSDWVNGQLLVVSGGQLFGMSA